MEWDATPQQKEWKVRTLYSRRTYHIRLRVNMIWRNPLREEYETKSRIRTREWGLCDRKQSSRSKSRASLSGQFHSLLARNTIHLENAYQKDLFVAMHARNTNADPPPYAVVAIPVIMQIWPWDWGFPWRWALSVCTIPHPKLDPSLVLSNHRTRTIKFLTHHLATTTSIRSKRWACLLILHTSSNP